MSRIAESSVLKSEQGQETSERRLFTALTDQASDIINEMKK
jgi:hypothetical protein